MDRARYGKDGELVTPQEFIRRASPRYKERGIFPYCPACREVVQLYGVHTPEGPSRFDHANRPIGANPFDDCILANRAGSRFEGMQPKNFDFNHGRKIRKEFFKLNNLKATRQFIIKLCGNIESFDEKFITLLRRANAKNIWSYANIPLWAIPYILLTLDNFIHNKNFEFHFYIKKNKSIPIDIIWENEGKSFLCKVFTKTGEPFTKTSVEYPLPISEENFKKYSINPSFITEDVMLKIHNIVNQSS